MPTALCVIRISIKSVWWTLRAWCQWRVVTGGVRGLPTVVSFNPETGLIVPVSGLDKVCVVLKLTPIRDLMVATIAKWATGTAVQKGGAWVILFTQSH